MPNDKSRGRLRAGRKTFWCSVFLVAVIAFVFLVPGYSDICQKSEYTGKEECAKHHFLLVTLWHAGEFLNYYGVAITAIATGFIGWFTFTLKNASLEQSRLTNESIELARKEFLSTHRPRLIVREAYLKSPVNLGDYFTVSVTAQAFGTATGNYEVVLNGVSVLNSGGTPYGQAVTVGGAGVFRADGTTTYTLTLRDATTQTCLSQPFTTAATANCSTINCPNNMCIPVLITVTRKK